MIAGGRRGELKLERQEDAEHQRASAPVGITEENRNRAEMVSASAPIYALIRSVWGLRTERDASATAAGFLPAAIRFS